MASAIEWKVEPRNAPRWRGAACCGERRRAYKADMQTRTRKLAGSIALLVFVALYMLLAMEVTAIFLNGANGLVQGIGYAFAGLIWIVPAGAIISWMLRPPK
jgi:Protein of unknown function (DUF2842)